MDKDIRESVASFATSGKLPARVLESTVFRRSYFENQFLPRSSALHWQLIKKRANPGLFLFIFVLLKTQTYRQYFKLQRDSNLDCRNRRRARWPLDHHHGPLATNLSRGWWWWKTKSHWELGTKYGRTNSLLVVDFSLKKFLYFA